MESSKIRKSLTLDPDVVQFIDKYSRTSRVSFSTAVNQILLIYKQKQQKETAMQMADRLMDDNEDVFEHLAK
ncbi:hypothetical protein [Persicobacter sp. CCB-QB2]|uniref:hypothetical protein n=1 Tax=Persicobacter sp. CCB-QB2 TaxID=1561025 RepID=UPI0006A9C100|nr:hypothetical protein [Persicobacter sp. CCB-QB2]